MGEKCFLNQLGSPDSCRQHFAANGQIVHQEIAIDKNLQCEEVSSIDLDLTQNGELLLKQCFDKESDVLLARIESGDIKAFDEIIQDLDESNSHIEYGMVESLEKVLETAYEYKRCNL